MMAKTLEMLEWEEELRNEGWLTKDGFINIVCFYVYLDLPGFQWRCGGGLDTLRADPVSSQKKQSEPTLLQLTRGSKCQSLIEHPQERHNSWSEHQWDVFCSQEGINWNQSIRVIRDRFRALAASTGIQECFRKSVQQKSFARHIEIWRGGDSRKQGEVQRKRWMFLVCENAHGSSGSQITHANSLSSLPLINEYLFVYPYFCISSYQTLDTLGGQQTKHQLIDRAAYK